MRMIDMFIVIMDDILRMIDMFTVINITMIMVIFFGGGVYMSKSMKLYTLNICDLLHISYISSHSKTQQKKKESKKEKKWRRLRKALKWTWSLAVVHLWLNPLA